MKDSMPSLPRFNNTFLTRLAQFRTDVDVWNSSWTYLLDSLGYEDELTEAIVCYPEQPIKFRQIMVDIARKAKIDVRQNGLFDMNSNAQMYPGWQSAIWTMPVVLAEIVSTSGGNGDWPMITLKPRKST